MCSARRTHRSAARRAALTVALEAQLEEASQSGGRERREGGKGGLRWRCCYALRNELLQLHTLTQRLLRCAIGPAPRRSAAQCGREVGRDSPREGGWGGKVGKTRADGSSISAAVASAAGRRLQAAGRWAAQHKAGGACVGGTGNKESARPMQNRGMPKESAALWCYALWRYALWRYALLRYHSGAMNHAL